MLNVFTFFDVGYEAPFVKTVIIFPFLFNSFNTLGTWLIKSPPILRTPNESKIKASNLSEISLMELALFKPPFLNGLGNIDFFNS